MMKKKKRYRKRWTKQEIEWLAMHFPAAEIIGIARFLSRSSKAIVARALKDGLV